MNPIFFDKLIKLFQKKLKIILILIAFIVGFYLGYQAKHAIQEAQIEGYKTLLNAHHIEFPQRVIGTSR